MNIVVVGAAGGIAHQNLSVVQSDVLDEGAMRRAIAGYEAVVDSKGTRTLLAAMASEGVRRYLGISASESSSPSRG
jgi:putative NADH-flavin reductase